MMTRNRNYVIMNWKKNDYF